MSNPDSQKAENRAKFMIAGSVFFIVLSLFIAVPRAQQGVFDFSFWAWSIVAVLWCFTAFKNYRTLRELQQGNG